MNKHRSGVIRIEVSDYLGEVDDDDLLDEVAARKLGKIATGGRTIDIMAIDIVDDARLELLRGRPAEALALLERLLNPKWTSAKDAQGAYDSLFRKSA